MSNLVSFSFEQSSVRVITDENGETLFVGKDICELLGYTNPSKAMNDHCKGVTKRYPLQTAGGIQELRTITEADMLRLVVNSKLPTAEKFEAWVFEEVLPSIRKTGEYKMPKKRQVSAVTKAKQAADFFPTMLKVAEICGLQGNAAILAANIGVKNVCGVNLLEVIERTHLLADPRGITYTPTQIAKTIGAQSARVVNIMLEEIGLQRHDADGHWVPTRAGEHLGEWYDTSKRNSEGTPIKQWKWFSDVADQLMQVEAVSG